MTIPWIELGVMLIYFGIRLYQIDLFPVFIDEVGYITWERQLVQGDFRGAANAFIDMKPLLPWLVAPLRPLENGLWIARTATVLMGVPALAALMMIGKTLFDRRVAITAGVVYSLLPLSFFLDRLMMSDPISANMATVAVWLIIVSFRDRRHRYATLAGAMLGIATLTKLSTLVIAATPLLVYWLIVPRRGGAVQTLVRIYGILAALAAVIAVGLGNTVLYTLDRITRFYVTTNSLSIFQRLINSIPLYVTWMSTYVGIPLLLLAAGGFLWAIVKRDRPMMMLGLLVILIDLLFGMVGGNPFPRYYLLGMGIQVLLACAAAWRGYHTLRRSKILQKAAWIGDVGMLALAVLTAAPMLRFIGLAYTAPQDLDLPPIDRADLIENRFSGFAVRENAGWLERFAQTGTPLTVLGNTLVCNRLDIYLYGVPGIEYAEMDALSPEWLSAQMATRAVFVTDDELVYKNEYDVLADYRLELVSSYPRPGGKTVSSLYRVYPPD